MRLHLTILLAAIVFASVTAGCDRRKTTAAPAKAPAGAKKEWTPEEIVKDPKGYLNWSDGQVAVQLSDREKKISAIGDRRKEFADRRSMLQQNIEDVANIRRRLADQYQRADDEDRWPFVLGGRSFTREKAQTILDQTKGYVEERQPLLGTYDQLLAKMDDTIASLRGDIRRLQQLRDRLAIDLEQVNLDQTTADVDRLRKTEQQLDTMRSAVASAGDDPLSIKPPKEPPGRVSIDEMLK